MIDLRNVPVFVLCGGLGTRFREETEFRPKPMIAIGSHPILWHIMRIYSMHGFKKFVLCVGYKAEVIKSYFLNYMSMNADFTVNLKSNQTTIHSVDHDQDWTVTLADTGELTMTGGRIARATEKYLGDASHFAVTYGDGVTNANLTDEFAFHCKHNLLGTVLGVNPPSRFGEFKLDGHRVDRFEEKPDLHENWVNGGYFFFRRDFTKYLSKDESCVLEKQPLAKLAADRQLAMYQHQGYWACMDTQRDRDALAALYTAGKAPWLLPPTPSEKGQ